MCLLDQRKAITFTKGETGQFSTEGYNMIWEDYVTHG
jgi:hypothetical protein